MQKPIMKVQHNSTDKRTRDTHIETVMQESKQYPKYLDNQLRFCTTFVYLAEDTMSRYMLE